MADAGYIDVLFNPENYCDEPGGEDLELRMPKMESFLMTANRIPANGIFDESDETFEQNMQNVLARIKSILEEKGVSDAIEGDVDEELEEEFCIDVILEQLMSAQVDTLKSTGLYTINLVFWHV